MSGKIPPEFIDALLARVDVVDVVNQRVPLQRAGSEYRACCPFHDEKTPSFYVSPAKQFYHCFGCGAHGSAIGFLMEYDRLSFPEAVEELARSVGMDLPKGIAFENAPDQRPLYRLLGDVADWYRRQLREHPAAERAVAYLKERGLSGEIAAEFGLGYAPPGWHNLEQAFGDRRQLLDQAGLLSERNGKRYDRFRDRVIFPIHDARGRVVGFGGRVLGDETPKYLNSPETPVFHKGRELYGLYQARRALKKIPRLLVVEGYMDVVALAQYGLRNVVATLGTATTADHLEKIFRATPEVVFCFDGDRAGRAAAWKALETALPLLRDGRQARFLFLPEGEDPDSLVRKEGAEAFARRVEQATPLSDYLFEHLASEVDMTTLDGRARLASLARPLLERLPAGPFRELLEQRLAQLTGTPLERPRAGRRRPRPAATRAPRLRPLHRAIALLLQYPRLATLEDLPAGWRELEGEGTAILARLLELAREMPERTTAMLIEHWQDPKIRHHLGRLAATPLVVAGDETEQFRGCLEKLAAEARRQALRRIGNKLRPSDLSEEEKARLRRLSKGKG